ncbi:MAG: DUF6020 family protein [Bacilli bacterium]|nr:DUF6020 family protein [Bacilli bacterium]
MLKKVITFILAIISCLPFFINYNAIYPKFDSINNLFKMELIPIFLLAVFLYILYNKYKNIKLHIIKKILAIFISLVMIFGNSYMKIASWDLVFGNILMLIISIITFISYYMIFTRIFMFIDEKLNNLVIKDIKLNKNTKLGKLASLLEEKPFLFSLICMLIFWLIYIIAFYPIILSPDPSFQIMQSFNVHTKYSDYAIQLDQSVNITNHHPVLQTLLFGGCIRLGRLILNDNFGLFIYSLIQIITLASVLAYTIKYCKKIGISNKVRYIMLGLYCLVPVFPFYAMSGVKDTFYSAFVILYIIFLYDFIRFYKDNKFPLKKIIKIIILLLLIGLFRNNGIYIIVLSLPFLIFYSKVNIKKILSIFIFVIGLYLLYSNVILPYFKITDGSIREALSIPFQQTARYVKFHNDELKEDEIIAIDKVLGYKTLVERYDPEKADPVKNNFNKYSTDKDLKTYFKVWARGLIKHPTTYIEATLNNTYGYFYPNATNWYFYYKYDTRITENNLVDYSYNNLDNLRDVLTSYAHTFPYIPGLGLITNIGFNTWLLLIILVYLIVSKNKKYIIIISPLLATLLVCVASPVNTYFRYAMPYIFAMPFLIAIFLNTIEKRKKDEK